MAPRGSELPSTAEDVSSMGFTHREILSVLWGVLLGMMMAALDSTIVTTALPHIASDLGGFLHLSWVITAYLLTSTIAAPIYGKLSDLYGRRRLLQFSIAVFVLSSASCGLAQNMGMLIASRACQGIGGGGLFSLGQAAIADVVSARERGRYQGYITGIWGLASIAGPLVGGLCTDYLTWRWAFYINLPVGVAAFSMVAWALKRIPVKKERRSIDFLGVALMVPGVIAWMLVCAWGGISYPWNSPLILGLGGAGLCFLLAFALQELRSRDALLPPRLFMNRNIRTVLITQFIVASTLLSTALLVPVFLQLVAGYSASESGLFMIPLIGSQMVGSITTGYRMRATGRYKRSPQVGFLGIMVSFILYATMTAATPFWLIALYFMVNGIAVGCCMSPMTVAGQNAADFRDLGAFTGTSGFFRSLGGSFGTALLWTALVLAFGWFLADGHLGFGPEVLRGGPQALADLPANIRAAIIPDLTHAFSVTFGIAAAISFAGFVSICFLEEIPLRTTPGKAPVASGE
ncbi:MAG TPA: MDR family MFS transporter [Stellaceae bacterium]|nr:MDR family MFS transporter [Stellaceae bacterium]